MLRTILILCTMFFAVGMANAGPLKLTNTQLDMVTAGSLTLPSLVEVFEGNTNQGTGDLHPSLTRPHATGVRGPWSAHDNSHKIN